MSPTKSVQCDDGSWIEVPSAYSFRSVCCSGADCPFVHILSFDENKNIICETTFSLEQLVHIVNSQGHGPGRPT